MPHVHAHCLRRPVNQLLAIGSVEVDAIGVLDEWHAVEGAARTPCRVDVALPTDLDERSSACRVLSNVDKIICPAFQ